ncbi:MAG: hypothetical protein AAF871_05740, partial [Pseudomonadota bacterium]
MPYILAAIGLLLAAYIWYIRAERAKIAAETLADAAKDVQAAARRFGFKRKTNVHPADAIEDPRLAIAGMAAAIAQMDAAWSLETAKKISLECQRVFGLPFEDAEETAVFAKWVSDQSATHAEMLRRLAKRLNVIGTERSAKDLAAFIEAMFEGPSGDLSDGAVEAV